MDTAHLVVLVVAAAAFFAGLVILAVNFAVAGSAPRAGVARGLSSIDSVYGAGQAERSDGGQNGAAPPNNRIFRLGRAATGGTSLARLRHWLDYAGNPPYWTVERIFEIKGVGLIVASIVGVMIGFGAGGLLGTVIGGVAGALVGFFIPDAVIADLSKRRQDKIRRSLPDILDTLTLSVQAGLGFDAALAQITRDGSGPVAGEFARVLQEMQIGLSRVEALRALGRRTNVIELRSFCAIIAQASELGVPIADVLREQAKEMRIRRRQRAEDSARKVSVKILFPLILCLLPATFIVILGPAMINILAAFHR